MTDNVIDRLDSLLAAEKEALLSGDLAAIGLILERKQALTDELSTSGGDVETLRPLRERLQRNAALYDAALAGIRRVTERLGTLQELRKSLDTYDAKGRLRSFSEDPEHRLEKRA